MRVIKGKLSIIVLMVVILINVVSCNQNNNVVNNVEAISESVNQSESIEGDINRLEIGLLNNTRVVMIKGEEAVNILASEDDYTIKLSLFDYASKFKSENILNEEKRKEVYNKTVVNWTEKQVDIITNAISSANELLDDKNINLPEEITIIITNGNVESGAAYTRGTSIIFPTRMMESMNEDSMLDLFLHELFHVYSRYNTDKREAMYGVIGYKNSEELVIPDDLKDLTIANPDAPDNNYYITCMYKGKEMSFVPIIFSNEPYDINSNESFFRYLNDDMLAVEINDSVPTPIRKDGKLLIVKKNELNDFYEQIGNNTGYTYHPEETMADNFVFLIKNEMVNDQWVLDGLAEIIFE